MRIGGKEYRTLWMDEGVVHMINQPKLPHAVEILQFGDYRQVVRAITEMTLRGAPAIGAAAAYAMVLAVNAGENPEAAAALIRTARPTAQDLFYGVDFMLDALVRGEEPFAAAERLAEGYINACKTIGTIGASLIPEGGRVSTHCNAGWLATVDWGTALAPVYTAHRQGTSVFVWVDETRPRCQGSRLTAFELLEEGIPHRVIADNAAGALIARGEVDLVIVGSDRIALNGDVANKIGTYSTALAARAAGIPFYVAAPLATVDRNCLNGSEIPIEERSEQEVSSMFGWCDRTSQMEQIRITPEKSPCANPAFDITPAEYIDGIITERGVVHPSRIEALL